jgi:hypothetical protein
MERISQYAGEKLNRELAEKYVKYIAQMVNRIELQKSVRIEDVECVNIELENFKKKIANENGVDSAIYIDLVRIKLELDDRYLEGSLTNTFLSIRKVSNIFSLLKLFESRDMPEAVVEGIRKFKRQLREYVIRFDEYNWI